MAVVAEVVGPGERPAGAGDRSEAFDEAGVEELGEAFATDARRAAGPVQLKELGGGEELVAPDVGEDLDVSRLDRARHRLIASAALDRGAVVANQLVVAGGEHQSRSKNVVCSAAVAAVCAVGLRRLFRRRVGRAASGMDAGRGIGSGRNSGWWPPRSRWATT